MLISFTRYGAKWQLVLGGVYDTGIFWEPHDLISDDLITLETQYTEALVNQACAMFPALKFDRERTKLEIALALYKVRNHAPPVGPAIAY